MSTILIADDHDVVRSGLNAILSSQSGWEVVAEAGALTALVSRFGLSALVFVALASVGSASA